MSKFDVREYIENLGNLNDKAKVRFFLKYLKEVKGDDALVSPEVFRTLDVEFFMGSLDAYIQEKVPSRQAAGDYKRTVASLCEAICKHYRISNDFLENIPQQDVFSKSAAERFKLLKGRESRGCIPFEDAAVLDEAIRELFDTENLEELVNDSVVRRNSKPNYYGHLVSAIALKLVQNYGLDNTTIANMRISELNLDDRIILAKGFKLYIDEELVSYFTLYLRCRNLVLECTDIQSDVLLIQKNGKQFLDKNGKPDSALFLLMDDTLHSRETSGIRLRTIKGLVSRGANIKLLHQLTNVKAATIAEKCLDDDKLSLENLFRNAQNTYIEEQIGHPQGLMRCPYCGEYKDACSENWVLIRVVGEDTKYLACRECNGGDGKYKY